MNDIETRDLNKITQFTLNMNNNEETIIFSALNIIKKNNKWIEAIKKHNLDEGFLMTSNPIIMEIKDAIYLDNPNHSGSSLAITLRKCNGILNQ